MSTHHSYKVVYRTLCASLVVSHALELTSVCQAQPTIVSYSEGVDGREEAQRGNAVLRLKEVLSRADQRPKVNLPKAHMTAQWRVAVSYAKISSRELRVQRVYRSSNDIGVGPANLPNVDSPAGVTSYQRSLIADQGDFFILEEWTSRRVIDQRGLRYRLSHPKLPVDLVVLDVETALLNHERYEFVTEGRAPSLPAVDSRVSPQAIVTLYGDHLAAEPGSSFSSITIRKRTSD